MTDYGQPYKPDLRDLLTLIALGAWVGASAIILWTGVLS